MLIAFQYYALITSHIKLCFCFYYKAIVKSLIHYFTQYILCHVHMEYSSPSLEQGGILLFLINCYIYIPLRSSIELIPINSLWVGADSILFFVAFQNLVVGTIGSHKIICEVNKLMTKSWLISGSERGFVHSHSDCLYCPTDLISGIAFLSSSFTVFVWFGFVFIALLHLSCLLSKDLACGGKGCLHTNYNRIKKVTKQILKSYKNQN